MIFQICCGPGGSYRNKKKHAVSKAFTAFDFDSDDEMDDMINDISEISNGNSSNGRGGRESSIFMRSVNRTSSVRGLGKQASSGAFASKKADLALALKRRERASIYSRPVRLDSTASGDRDNILSSNRQASNGSLNSGSTFYEETPPKTPEEEAFLKEVLSSLFLLQELQESELLVLVEAMKRLVIKPGMVVGKCDETQDYAYVVESGVIQGVKECGEAEIEDQIEEGDEEDEESGESTKKWRRGDVIAELALLYGCPRSRKYEVVGEDEAVLWAVSHVTFRRVLARHARDQDKGLVQKLRRIELFSSLGDATMRKFAKALTQVTFVKGDRIVQKGEEGNVFYILEEGSVRVHDIGIGDSLAVDQILSEPGDWFGERALLTGEPRAANITAISDTVKTLAMDRETFEARMGPLKDQMEHQEKLNSLKALPTFGTSDISDIEIEQLADFTVETCYREGQKLATAGKPYEQSIWIIRHGRLNVYGDKTGRIFSLKSGDYFGEKSIHGEEGHISSHDAICEENLTTWRITKEHIETVIGDLKRLGESKAFRKTRQTKKVMPEDLKKFRILGVGAFGRVWLVQHKKSKEVYALKEIRKRKVLDAHQQRGVIREKELLSMLNHPFILDLVSSFQSTNNLYLVMPIIQGGELFSIVNPSSALDGIGRKLTNDDVAFYSSCIVEALGHFHHRAIAYRDLKLENVLLDAEGYCKIVDLGFAKVVLDGKTYTFCGTPEYIAPEIIMAKGHDHAVDYWSLGVMIFEMLTGRSPFQNPKLTQMQMFKLIVLVKYSFPDEAHQKHISPAAKDIIQKLLVRKPSDRLGNLRRGFIDVRSHEWFKESSIDYKLLLKKELTPPWKPPVSNPLDSSHFDDWDEESSELSDMQLTDEEQAIFKGF